jgi:DNA polymerase-3 subunit gamma/tau
MAKALRCPHAKDYVPCGVCKECLDIAASRALDVIEIDGASNNGVENVRELIDSIGYMPSSGQHKIYILDEVHMLSTSAFNALLKTFEEPPAHVVFVLATTEVHKIPNTILSRCQRFDFRRIATGTVVAQLEAICQSEGRAAESDALWILARQGEGSLRDSLSLLDQVMTFTAGPITLEQVLGVLGLTDRRLRIEALAALVAQDLERTLKVCAQVFAAGYDAKIFVQDLLETIRHTLFLRLDAPVDLPDSEAQALRGLAQSVSNEDLHLLFDMALKGAQDVMRTTDTQVVLEMLMLRMAEAPKMVSLTRLLAQPNPTPPPKPPKPPQPTEPTPPMDLPEPPPPMTEPEPKPVPTTLAEKWQDLVHKIKAVNGMVGAKLENSFLQSLDNQNLVVGVPGKLKFLYDQVQEPAFQKKVQNYLTTFWGPGHTLRFEIGQTDADGNVTSTPKALSQQRSEQQHQELRQKIENHPFVKTAQSVFKSEIKAIKEAKR